MPAAQAVVTTIVDHEVSTTVVDVASASDGTQGTTGRAPALTGDELFPVYSVTKPLLATAVMLLVERGRLSLDEDVRRRLPHLPLDRPVTVRQLLDHTGGLPDYGAMPEYTTDLRADPTRPWTREEFLSRTLPKGLMFEPGTGWAYSNLGYLCLVLLLEQEHQAPLSELLRREMFAPLGLERTRVADTLDDMSGLAPSWSTAISPDGTAVGVPGRYHPGWVAHGLVLSTAPELARLFGALFDGRIVSGETLTTMTEPVSVPFDHRLFNRPSYGLGLMVDAGVPGLLAGHGGGGPGYSTGALHAVHEDGRRVTAVALAATEVDEVGLTLAFDAAQEVRAGR